MLYLARDQARNNIARGVLASNTLDALISYMEHNFVGFPDIHVDITDPVNFLTNVHHTNPLYMYTVAEMEVLNRYLHWHRIFSTKHIPQERESLTVGEWLQYIRRSQNAGAQARSSSPPPYYEHAM